MTTEKIKELFYYKDGKLFRKKGRHKDKPVGWITPKGYVATEIDSKYFLLHRLIWQLFNTETPDEIDHINGNRSDNRIENLRNVSRFQNMNNLGCHRDGINVGIRKRHNKYAAYITINKKKRYIGLYKDERSAIEARKRYIKTNAIT